MPKETMHRQAGDNAYLHQDFHGALSVGLVYLERRYDEDAVREYLAQFARAYYAPLSEAIRRRGLEPLESHFSRIYALEGGQVEIERDENQMTLRVEACPAVGHMRRQGYPVSRLFYETTKTVNEMICEGTPFEAELVEYDAATGRSIQRFRRRAS